MRRTIFAAIKLGLLTLALLAGPGAALADEAPDATSGFVQSGIPGDETLRPWGVAGPSPYYPPNGLQSPFRLNGLHLGGDAWIDTGYEASQRELSSEPDQQFWLMQGRAMLDLTATRSYGRFFAQAKAQILAHVEEIPGNEHIDTDDSWIRFGMWDMWDFQVGRFEAWEVYHKGEGLERDTLEDKGAADGADIYEVNYAYYRQDGFGQFAAHAYPLSWLRFEAASVFGNELGFNSIGVRTAGILDVGWMRLKLAGEYRKLMNQEEGKKQWEEKRGFGGGLQFHVGQPGDPFWADFGANGAYGVVDRVNAFGKVDETGSPDTLSMGGYLDLGLSSAVLGFGYNHTFEGDRQWNDQSDQEGYFQHQQLFASVRHPIFFQWLNAKLVFAWANANLDPAFDNPRTNDMYSLRLRLYMTF